MNLSETSGQVIVAHRGASHDAPENTLSAFQLAWKNGADAIEGDFHLTKDRRIVCIHDRDTERTAGKKLTISKSTLDELSQLDVGSWKAKKFAGERIPTLEQVLTVVPADKQILVEVKCGAEIVPILKTVLDQSKLKPEQITVISFDADVIAASKKSMPKIKAFWLTSFKQDKISGKWSPTPDEIFATLEKCSADGLDCKAELKTVDESFVRRLRRANMEFHCWTVDDPKVAERMRSLGVDSITTNRPDYLRRSMRPQSARQDKNENP